MTHPNQDITWGEFKERVSLEVSDDSEISWIDTRGSSNPDVKFYADGSAYIVEGNSRYEDDA